MDLTFFQDLPEVYQDKIIGGMRNNKHHIKSCKDMGISLKFIDEYIDNYINCNNTIFNVKYWVETYCL